MSYHFSQAQHVRWNDLDSHGILNNAIYLTMLEQARWGYFSHLELTQGDRFPFVLGETAIRFLKPGRVFGDIVTACRVSRLGTKSFDMEYELTQNDIILAKAQATLVWVDDNLQSVAIPEHCRQVIRDFEDL